MGGNSDKLGHTFYCVFLWSLWLGDREEVRGRNPGQLQRQDIKYKEKKSNNLF